VVTTFSRHSGSDFWRQQARAVGHFFAVIRLYCGPTHLGFSLSSSHRRPLGSYCSFFVVGHGSIQCMQPKELCEKLKTPRKIILLVKAGPAVGASSAWQIFFPQVLTQRPADDFIAQLEPHLEKGDIVIDGGNSHFPDSIRRTHELERKGLLFVGSGVSGGEEGARYGPSLSTSSLTP
jgi:hypothetical protein